MRKFLTIETRPFGMDVSWRPLIGEFQAFHTLEEAVLAVQQAGYKVPMEVRADEYIQVPLNGGESPESKNLYMDLWRMPDGSPFSFVGLTTSLRDAVAQMQEALATHDNWEGQYVGIEQYQVFHHQIDCGVVIPERLPA